MQHAACNINTVMHSGLMTAMGWWYHMQAVGIKITTVRCHLVTEGKLKWKKTRLHFSAVAIQVFVIMSWVWQPLSLQLLPQHQLMIQVGRSSFHLIKWLIISIGYHKEIRKLTFWALALCRSESKGLLETSAFEFLYVVQFTLSSQLIKPNYLVILPTDAATQFL